MLHDKTILLDDGFKVGVIESDQRTGPTLVFLHGWSVSAAAYTEMLEALEPHFHVIALDAPDHGHSDALRWGHSIGDMAHIILRALDKLGVTKAVMVGHSMGGGIVVEFASRYPDYTSAAILINAAAGQQHHEALQMALTPEGLLRAAELITGALRDIIGDARLAAEKRSVTELLSLSSRLAKSMSGAPMLKAGIALLRHNTSFALHHMKVMGVPTVVIHGSDDRIINEGAARQAARASGAKYVALQGHNHSWMIADVQKAAACITSEARRLLRMTTRGSMDGSSFGTTGAGKRHAVRAGG